MDKSRNRSDWKGSKDSWKDKHDGPDQGRRKIPAVGVDHEKEGEKSKTKPQWVSARNGGVVDEIRAENECCNPEERCFAVENECKQEGGGKKETEPQEGRYSQNNLRYPVPGDEVMHQEAVKNMVIWNVVFGSMTSYGFLAKIKKVFARRIIDKIWE